MVDVDVRDVEADAGVCSEISAFSVSELKRSDPELARRGGSAGGAEPAAIAEAELAPVGLCPAKSAGLDCNDAFSCFRSAV